MKKEIICKMKSIKKTFAYRKKAIFMIAGAILFWAARGMAEFAINLFSLDGISTERLELIITVEGAIMFVITAFAVTLSLFKNDRFLRLLTKIFDSIIHQGLKESKISQPSRYRLLKLSEFLFSLKTYEDVFLTAMADWDEEIYNALKEDENASLLMINLRNTYGFILAMWQKSPIGDLIEFVVKIAKQ